MQVISQMSIVRKMRYVKSTQHQEWWTFWFSVMKRMLKNNELDMLDRFLEMFVQFN